MEIQFTVNVLTIYFAGCVGDRVVRADLRVGSENEREFHLRGVLRVST